MADSLLDEFRAHVKPKGPTCTMGKALAAMSEEDRAQVKVALADQAIQGTVISTVLKKRGIPVSKDAVQRHRRGSCCCSEI